MGLSWFGTLLGAIIVGVIANRDYEDYLIKKGYSIVKMEHRN